jgi:hypothetical protein
METVPGSIKFSSQTLKKWPAQANSDRKHEKKKQLLAQSNSHHKHENTQENDTSR